MPGRGNLPLEACGPEELYLRGGNMKTWICKRTIAISVACLTLGGAALAQGGSCSNASLKGTYGQAISGELLPAPGVVLPQNGVAMTNFDGKGKFTQEDFVVINGAPTSSGFTGETGTYSINSDCTGTATINYPDGSWIDLELVVVNQGHEFRTVVSQLTMGGTAVPVNIGSDGVRVDTPTPGGEIETHK
jgi:hypothetical protein